MDNRFPVTLLNPEWLLLLPLVMLVCVLFHRFYRTRSMWSEFFDAHLLKVLLPGATAARSSNRVIWIIASVLTLIVLAAAGPSWRTLPIPLYESAASRVVVLDLSQSMLAQDVEPTRFKRAVFKARDLVNAAGEGQTALVAFAGAAFLVSPLTDDKQTLLNFLDSLKPEIMPIQGSRIDLGLTMAGKILSASFASSSQVYVITDGVSKLDAAIEQAAALAHKTISVSILAVGTEQGGPIKDATGKLVYDQAGELIIARVGFADLEKIAAAGKGRFTRLTASNQDINFLLSGSGTNLTANSHDADTQTLNLPINDGVWLVWLILPLALLLFRHNALWVVMLLLLPVQQDAYAFDWTSKWKNNEQRAFEAYQKGDYQSAIELSNDSQLKGSAYYKNQDFKNAEAVYARQGDAQSFYNRGNALANMHQFDLAIAAYNRVLEQDPQHQSAKFNKSLIEAFLSQQRNQQQADKDSREQRNGSNDNSNDESDSNPGAQEPPGSPQSSADDDLQSDSDEEQQQEQNRPAQEGNPADQDYALSDEVASEAQSSNPESIDRWINRLPDDPAELLRRKFLRDYQRQQRQP